MLCFDCSDLFIWRYFSENWTISVVETALEQEDNATEAGEV